MGLLAYIILTPMDASYRQSPVASIPRPIPGGRGLRPVKNRGSFDNVADQNSPLFFTSPPFSLDKLHSYFYFPLFLLGKLHP